MEDILSKTQMLLKKYIKYTDNIQKDKMQKVSNQIKKNTSGNLNIKKNKFLDIDSIAVEMD